MAKREFVGVAATSKDGDFVVLIERERKSFVGFVAPPKSRWSQELKTQAGLLGARVTYVRQLPSVLAGEVERVRGAEFLKLTLDARTVIEAAEQAEFLLTHLTNP